MTSKNVGAPPSGQAVPGTDGDVCRSDVLASQGRLVWEAELDTEAGGSADSLPGQKYAAAWEYWTALDTLAVAEVNLLALDPRPLLPYAHRRRRRRDGTGGGPASAAPGGLSGAFPKRRATVTAEVLARLLKGETLTGMDAVFECSTTRLADHVYRLRHEYGWSIDGQDLEVRTKDARAAQISEYRLPHDVIEAALATGGAEFCTEVFAARAAQRSGARGAKTNSADGLVAGLA